MEIIKNIGAIVGMALSCLTLITLLCKPLRKKISGWIRQVSQAEEYWDAIERNQMAIDEIRAGMQQIMATEESKQVLFSKFQASQLSILRDDITRLYFKYLENKQVPFYARKDMVQLYETYTDMGGNSYVKTIYDEFMEWPVKT